MPKTSPRCATQTASLMRCVIGWHRAASRVDAPVLVGYSMGGRIAAGAVVRYPNLPLAGLCF